MGTYQHVKDSRQRLKERLVFVMGEKCQICGYNKCIQALDFHHLDPSKKEFGIGTNTNNSWAKMREEVKKCILVCANCHREIHSGLIDTSVLTSSFSEDKAKIIDQELYDIKHRKKNFCIDCGKEISAKIGTKRCIECSNKNNRKVERPDRQTLKNKIRINTFVNIGKEYGVRDNTIRKWCKAYNLPSKKEIINKFSDEEWNKI